MAGFKVWEVLDFHPSLEKPRAIYYATQKEAKAFAEKLNQKPHRRDLMKSYCKVTCHIVITKFELLNLLNAQW